MPVIVALPFIGIFLLIGAGVLLFFMVVNQIRFNRWCRRHGLPGLTLRALAMIHLREYVAIIRVLWWNLRAPLANYRDRPAGRPVLMVHGYTQNSTNFWVLKHELEALERPTRTVFLGIPWPWRRVGTYANALERALDRQDPERGVDLVAHSMGGLVLREVLRRRPDLRDRVKSVVTLGTPHHGTAAARWFTWMHPTHELSYRSAWVEELPSLSDLLPGKPVTTVGGTADMIVYPVESTYQPDARLVVLPGVGHAGLLVHPQAIQAVLEGVTA